jgi:predicted GNAT family N-acyltransferase
LKKNIRITEISAKETYSLRQRVMWPNKSLDFIKLENDNKGIHFALWKDATIVSVISLFIEGDSAQFRKFATDTSEHGNCYGSFLITYLINFVITKNVLTLWCNAREDKTFFYKRFGMTQTSNTFLKEGIKYIIMEKNILPKK